MTAGGTSTTGGALANGGTSSMGGASSMGGTLGSGGSTGAGGATSSGGSNASGGATASGGAGSGAGGAPTGSGGSSGTGYPYVFSVFNDAAAVSSLQIYTSNDGLNFTLLADTGFTGPTTNLRDPSIMKHTDGKFYVAFTTPPAGNGCCGPESSFSIASSSNLKNWTTVATVPSGVSGVTNVWAPEWFKDSDGSLHILVSIDKKTYRYEPTDATLTKFGAGTFIGIGPDFIDTIIVKLGATYHAFPKRESTTYIEHATATNIDGPWTFVGTGNWAGWGNHKEAPSLIQLANGTWRMFCDAGSTGHEMYSDSTDLFKSWSAMKGLPTVGNNISHGTVIKGN
ncbi:MAG: hypothetical protein QM756_07770 [Polyangiaceae bacterium]